MSSVISEQARRGTVGRPAADTRAAEALTVRRSSSDAVLLAPVLAAAAVAVLAWDYATLPDLGARYALYWVAIGLAFAATVVLATIGNPGSRRQLVALGMFGALTWLPYYLRSPSRLLFVDERYHLDILIRIAEGGHTNLPLTLFPLPGTFPGLELGAFAVMASTELDALGATRVITLALHVVIPMLAYLAARGFGLSRGAALLAAVVYVSNTAFVFFHSVFSYESLGITLFLATWAAIGLYRPSRTIPTDPRRLRTLLLLVGPLLAAIAVTHHVSSYMLAGSLGIAALAARRQRVPEARALALCFVMAVIFNLGWFVLAHEQLVPYLGTTLAARVDVIVRTLLLERSQPRPLFANSELPSLERGVAFAYPVVVFLVGLRGLFLLWRSRRGKRQPLPGVRDSARFARVAVALALFGPIGWVVTAPAVLTRAGEIAYRSWPFLFLGVGVFAAFALVDLTRRARALRLGSLPAFAVCAVLVVGGFSIGDNQAGRFPTPPVTAAGPGNVNAEVIDAARWLRATVGEGHILVSDTGTSGVFAAEGGQRVVAFAAWIPFIAPTAEEVETFLADRDVEFLVVDRQIADLPARYGSYFGHPAIPASRDPGQPFPRALLDRFDTLAGLDRIYDGGRIVIYRRVREPAS